MSLRRKREVTEERNTKVHKQMDDNPSSLSIQICPYLHTVNRQVLDFDFEKKCSVSHEIHNVYACLVCGKYFQGKGPKSYSYIHSRATGHHVYMNLHTEKIYCISEGCDSYEILDSSLDDIRYVLNPRFTREQIDQLDTNKQWSRALDGSGYLPGMVGLNNLKETEFVNVAIQSLMRVTPLRNFFLIPENYKHCKSPLVHRFGELTRKIWHAHNFRRQVNPHEFFQSVRNASGERFHSGAQSDPFEFISWLLDTLHSDLITSNKKTSIIHQCFQGEMEAIKEIHTKHVAARKHNGNIQRNGNDEDWGADRDVVMEEKSRIPFLMLELDLPPPPLFKDMTENNIFPQVPLSNILKKFDGKMFTEDVRYRVTKLPQYLILHIRRFTKNDFFEEKNSTLVDFPVKNLELKDYIPLPPPRENEKVCSKYDLVANIVHDGKPREGFYKVFVQRKSDELWVEMQDLHVAEVLPQMVKLSEAYMLIYEQEMASPAVIYIYSLILCNIFIILIAFVVAAGLRGKIFMLLRFFLGWLYYI